MKLDIEGIAARAEQVAICLDFDGTLSPIVDDPEEAQALPGIDDLLERLARRLNTVAVISGRPASELLDRVGAAGVRYVGIYGMEEVVDGVVSIDPDVEPWQPRVRAALGDLSTHPAVTGADAHLEDKSLSVVVHLRRVGDLARWSEPLRLAAFEVADRHGLRVIAGRLVWELAPPVARDKGDAVRKVMAESGANAVVVVGDDLGDLPAFEAAAEFGRRGAGILRVAVSSPESPPELLGQADEVVDQPEGVRELLRRLAAAVDRSAPSELR
jgi:trehalose 6-phosphate phosphatase